MLEQHEGFQDWIQDRERQRLARRSKLLAVAGWFLTVALIGAGAGIGAMGCAALTRADNHNLVDHLLGGLIAAPLAGMAPCALVLLLVFFLAMGEAKPSLGSAARSAMGRESDPVDFPFQDIWRIASVVGIVCAAGFGCRAATVGWRNTSEFSYSVFGFAIAGATASLCLAWLFYHLMQRFVSDTNRFDVGPVAGNQAPIPLVTDENRAD